MLQVNSSGDAPAGGDDGQESEVDALHRRCGVYTKPAVVQRILDGVGWTHEHGFLNLPRGTANFS